MGDDYLFGAKLVLVGLLCVVLPASCINLDQLADSAQRIAAKECSHAS
jgi:hypothetical protein